MAQIHERLGLTPVINASGTMTSIGASRVVPQAAAAVGEILTEFVDIASLQARASAVIAKATASATRSWFRPGISSISARRSTS